MDSIQERLSKQKDPARTGYLIGCYMTETLSIEEREELEEWLYASYENMELFDLMTEEKEIDGMLKWIANRDTEGKLVELKKRIPFKSKRKVRFWQLAAAASLVIVIATALYFILYRSSTPVPVAETLVQDVKPGALLAQLRLADGKVIALDGLKDTSFNGITIHDGEVVYDASVKENAIHEVIVPRKGFYKLVLPDGTKVFLNNESSIVYPAAFTGNTREVKVTGETFFEVASDKLHPLIVSINEMKVQAVGTAFNIDGFENRVTLTEGIVMINGMTMNIGQQYSNGKLVKVDTAPVTAWKQNEFRFKNVTMKEIAKLLERWYDCEVVLNGNIPDHFYGVISRDVPLSKVMALLQEVGGFHYVIKDNVITISK